MSQQNPQLSVITGIYNGSAYLDETIKSVLNQSFTDFEYILVDDGSKDESIEIVKSFKDKRIRLVVNSSNLGLVKTRNLAFELARGEFIALTDQDDLSKPNRFSTQLEYLKKYPDVNLVATWARTILGNTGQERPKKHRAHSALELQYGLLFRNAFVNSTLMMRKASVPVPAYSPEFPVCEDYNFLIEMAARGTIALIHETLVDWRFHGQNYSGKKAQDIERLARVLQSKQLQKLSVKHSEKELALHFSIAELSNPTSVQALVDAKGWLEKVCRNTSLDETQRTALRKIVAEEWGDLAHRCTNLGWEAWKIFNAFSKEQQFAYSLTSRAKLATKCLIRKHS